MRGLLLAYARASVRFLLSSDPVNDESAAAMPGGCAAFRKVATGGRGTHRLPRQAQKLPPIVIPGQMRNPPPLPAVAWLKVKSGLAKKPPSD